MRAIYMNLTRGVARRKVSVLSFLSISCLSRLLVLISLGVSDAPPASRAIDRSIDRSIDPRRERRGHLRARDRGGRDAAGPDA